MSIPFTATFYEWKHKPSKEYKVVKHPKKFYSILHLEDMTKQKYPCLESMCYYNFLCYNRYIFILAIVIIINSLRPSDAYMRRYSNQHWFR